MWGIRDVAGLRQEGQNQIQSREPLLAVDDLEVCGHRLSFGHDEVPEEVAVLAIVERVLDVAYELLYLLGPPRIIPLVDRHGVDRV